MKREILVDARWLEPPEPMERALAALEGMTVAERVRLLIHREPFPLYALLQEKGYRHQTYLGSDGCYEVVIELDTSP